MRTFEGNQLSTCEPMLFANAPVAAWLFVPLGGETIRLQRRSAALQPHDFLMATL